jgi:predicted RNA-binding Zn ribbon-like protein
MAGETHNVASRPPPQPGGRVPAPGELSLVQAFINTHYDLEIDHGAELLADPVSLSGWLSGHGLIDAAATLQAADVDRTLVVRERLRDVARRNGGGPPAATALEQLNEAAAGAWVQLRFSASGPSFTTLPGAGIDGALGRLLAIVAAAMIDGSWHRLKVCPGEDCGWAFYDHSRNQTGRWCSMAVCGGRSKARAHYRRRRELS